MYKYLYIRSLMLYTKERNMSFTEIIHWGALVIGLAMGSVYTVLTWGATTVDEIAGALLVTVIVLVVAIVLFAIAVAIPMAIRSKGNFADQRDDEMELGAMPYTFSALVIGSVWAINDIIVRNAQDRTMDPVTTLNILLGSVFAAVVVGSAVTLVRYRLGTR